VGLVGPPIGPPPRRLILDDFEDWLADLKKHEGGENFRWARSYEKDMRGEDDSVRILVGGLRDRTRQWREWWSTDPLMSTLHHFSKRHSLKAFDYLLDPKGRHGKLDFKYDRGARPF